MELRRTCKWKILRNDNIFCLWRTNTYIVLVVVILLFVQMTDSIRPTGPFRIEETISSLNDKKKEIENQTSLDEYLQEFFPNQNRSEVVSNIAQKRPSPFQRRSGRHKENMFDKVDREAQRVVCGKPREILVDSYTELGFAKGFGTKLFPSCIVVDRCKNSGCCQESEECRASRTMNVTREFLNNGELISRTVAKDLECECRKKPAFCPETNTTCPEGKQWSDSACKCVCKKCPSLFIIDEEKCTCDCLVSNRLCKNHAKGKRYISPEDCKCIKSGLCNPPQCINGHYDAEQCRCVQDHVER